MPGIYFIAGGRIGYYSDKEERELAIKDFLNARKEHIGKALFVTEYISTGEGIRWVGDIFEQVGIEYLLAAVSIRAPEHIENIPMATAMFQRMRYGSTGCIGVDYAYGMDASGVIKIPAGEFKDVNTHHPAQSLALSQSDPKEKRSARNDMKYLARELSKLLEVEV